MMGEEEEDGGLRIAVRHPFTLLLVIPSHSIREMTHLRFELSQRLRSPLHPIEGREKEISLIK
jgi:hypothetical protein